MKNDLTAENIQNTANASVMQVATVCIVLANSNVL